MEDVANCELPAERQTTMADDGLSMCYADVDMCHAIGVLVDAYVD